MSFRERDPLVIAAPPQDTALTLRDLTTVLRRRKWLFVVPAAVVLALAVGLALFQTPVYRSEATILIEDAEIPEDLMTTLVRDYVEERLAAIERRIMVTDSLLAIIDRYNLYPEERARRPVAEVVEVMRENIRREMIRAEIVDPRTGQERSVTVAFNLSFDHPQPETAQRITNELVSLYLNENLRQRREMASGTTSFFRGERQQVEERIAEIERQLAEFKQANSGSLPEQLLYSQQIIARTEQEIRDLDRQVQVLKERQAALQAQLAVTDPFGLDGGGEYASPAAQLESKRTQLATLNARYGPEHPNVINLRREIAALEQTVGGGQGAGALEAERARLLGELDALRGRYADDHPDVRRVRRELDGVEAALRAAGGRSAGNGVSPSSPRATNPAYIGLQVQLESVAAELEAIQEWRSQAVGRLDRHEQLVLQAPLVEREYARLQRSLDDAMALRDELARKETTALLGQTLETELKAERLSLIEPPSLPTEPVKPNRPRILLLGFGLALVCGAVLVVAAQAFDEGVYSDRHVAAVVGEAPLVVVPRIVTEVDRTRSRAAVLAAALVIAGGLGAAAWWVHVRYVPLDVAYYDLQRRVLTGNEP